MALIGPLPLCPVLVNRRMDDGLEGKRVDSDERNSPSTIRKVHFVLSSK